MALANHEKEFMQVLVKGFYTFLGRNTPPMLEKQVMELDCDK